MQLLDDGAVALDLDDRLDPLVLVAGNEEEGRSILSDALVLLERRLDAGRAGLVAALADELRLLGVEALGRLGDPLVDLAEERFGPREPLNFLVLHRSCRLPDAVESDNERGPGSGALRKGTLAP
jgi:hypothetical protein